MEIERKYLTKKIPFNLETFNKINISQCYISFEPVIRLRNSDEKFTLTVKSKGLATREEFELSLTREQYNKLILKSDSKTIEKVRYFVPLDSVHTAEVDIYHSFLEGLITTEVEFSSEKDMESFKAPKWFGEDVTMDSRYKNTNLSLYGIPEN